MAEGLKYLLAVLVVIVLLAVMDVIASLNAAPLVSATIASLLGALVAMAATIVHRELPPGSP